MAKKRDRRDRNEMTDAAVAFAAFFERLEERIVERVEGRLIRIEDMLSELTLSQQEPSSRAGVDQRFDSIFDRLSALEDKVETIRTAESSNGTRRNENAPAPDIPKDAPVPDLDSETEPAEEVASINESSARYAPDSDAERTPAPKRASEDVSDDVEDSPDAAPSPATENRPSPTPVSLSPSVGRAAVPPSPAPASPPTIVKSAAISPPPTLVESDGVGAPSVNTGFVTQSSFGYATCLCGNSKKKNVHVCATCHGAALAAGVLKRCRCGKLYDSTKSNYCSQCRYTFG